MSSLILFLISIGLIIPAYLEKRIENIKDKKPNTWNLATSIILMFSALVTYYLGCQNEAKDKIAENNRITIDSLIMANSKLTKVQYDSVKKILSSSQDIVFAQKQLLDSSSSILTSSKVILSSQSKILDTSTIILNDNRDLLRLQKRSNNILSTQIDSVSKTLALSKELLNYHTNDDSLVIVSPSRRGNYIVFKAFNSGDYPVNNVVINFPNLPFIDSVSKLKDLSKGNRLTPEEGDNWRKQIKISLDSKRYEEFYRLNIKDFNKDYRITFDVKWSKRFIKYSYSFRFTSNSEGLVDFTEEHIDVNQKKHFILQGTTPIYK